MTLTCHPDPGPEACSIRLPFWSSCPPLPVPECGIRCWSGAVVGCRRSRRIRRARPLPLAASGTWFGEPFRFSENCRSSPSWCYPSNFPFGSFTARQCMWSCRECCGNSTEQPLVWKFGVYRVTHQLHGLQQHKPSALIVSRRSPQSDRRSGLGRLRHPARMLRVQRVPPVGRRVCAGSGHLLGFGESGKVPHSEAGAAVRLRRLTLL